MELKDKVTIQPPPYTDHNNKLINPPPLSFTFLDVTYVDNPKSKTVFASIQGIPGKILLINPAEYDSIGNYTQDQIENILRDKLGDDIGSKLRSLFPKTLEENPNGPGTILAGMFSSLGIKSSPTCSCRRHAIEMNDKGADWCEQNIDTIVGWLKEESKKRKIPFVESLAVLVVKRAVRQSRKLSL